MRETYTPDVSIILPIHNERENIEPLLDEIETVFAKLDRTFEVIAVDDASRDGTTALLDRLWTEREYLRVVFFRRNSGQAAAFDAGFRQAEGAIVVTMDADRQNDPNDIPAMIKLLDDDNDVVVGWRKKRHDDFVRTIPSRMGNWLIRKVTGTKLHDMGCSLRVARKAITDDIQLYGEAHRFLTILAEHTGARVAEFVVNHRPRVAGKSKYGLSRTFKVLFDLFGMFFLRGYETKPIYFFGFTAVIMFALASGASLYVLYEKVVHEVWVHRNPLFVLAMIAFLMSVQLMFMGLTSEMIMRTFFEARRRRPYFIAKVAGRGITTPSRVLRSGDVEPASMERPSARHLGTTHE